MGNSMKNFNDYQEKCLDTANYTNYDSQITCTILGLVGESGEVADKLKKVIRDKGGKLSKNDVEGIKMELGDVLWYLSVLSHTLGIKLQDIVDSNIIKLQDRKKRNVISGSGDNR